MSKQSSKIAASAAVVAGLVVAVTIYVTGGGSTVAMAAVLEQLQTKCYEFEMSIQTEDGAAIFGKGMVLEPGRMRLEQSGDLGEVTSIFDTNARQTLVLFKRWKAAYLFDGDDTTGAEVIGFVFLPKRSIEGLWSLKAGDESALGKRDIDGKAAEGFRVTQEGQGHTHTITVWADSKVGHPLRVEIALGGEKGGLVLSNFRVVPEPRAALFGMEVPAGYTLADSQTLDQLTTESNASDSTTESTSAQAKIVLDAFALAADGKTQEAVELLVTVDWSDNFRFAQEHHFFTMSERQQGSLASADREKVSAETMVQSAHCRAILRTLLELGRTARTSKDVAQAEKYFSTVVRLGELLNRDGEMMTVVRMTGIALQQIGLKELSLLYEDQGETEKLRSAQSEISQVDAQLEQIKAGL